MGQRSEIKVRTARGKNPELCRKVSPSLLSSKMQIEGGAAALDQNSWGDWQAICPLDVLR